jgi:hypothetical protein
VNVTVTTPNGTSAAVPGGFTYIAAPTLISASPNAGPVAGGTTVVVAGTNLAGATAVSVGGTPATSFTVNNNNQLTLVTPVHAAGVVDIAVTTASGTGTLTGGYTYVPAPAPTLTAVSPSQGFTSGGTSVSLGGTNLTGATAVSFGGTPALSFTVDSDNLVSAVVPAGSAGAVDVVVTTPLGTATLEDGFTYVVAPNPSLASPSFGPIGGGTVVNLTGTGFTGTTSVTVGGNPGTDVSVDSDTQITFTTPVGVVGQANIVVTTPVGSGTLTNGFTYLPAPTLTNITPFQGNPAGGTTVIISGSGLTGATSVTFGGDAATSFTVLSDSQIEAVTPGGTGEVDVVVTTPGGSDTLAGGFNGFEYIDLTPTVTLVTPPAGPTSGGSVTILGSNLGSTTGVTFDGTPATIWTVLPNLMVGLVPAHAAGVVNIVVTTEHGTATATYTYVAAPGI